MTNDNEIEHAGTEISEEFALFDDWTDRYQYIIDMGKKLPPFPEADKTEANRLHGCQSQVWMTREMRDGRLYFQAISDAAIVSGLIALLMRVYSGRRPAEILATPPEFLERIQLSEHLSPTRSNGLHAMLRYIRDYAAEAAAQA
ncbi:MAG: SufE family protein [Gammaproteobacteria bacterium]|nr:SufE family protein [Gammaproteobacteria bacterium]